LIKCNSNAPTIKSNPSATRSLLLVKDETINIFGYIKQNGGNQPTSKANESRKKDF
jgi:hypothetical protein